MVRAAEVFRPAVRDNAPSIIVVHNHPSGDPTPSPEDINITRELISAGKLLSIELLDHLVIGDGNRYVSLNEKGLGPVCKLLQP
jgi:DNA repair protein RadC